MCKPTPELLKQVRGITRVGDPNYGSTTVSWRGAGALRANSWRTVWVRQSHDFMGCNDLVQTWCAGHWGWSVFEIRMSAMKILVMVKKRTEYMITP